MAQPLRSFVDVAPDSHFPIQNLPFGVFRPRNGGDARVGVAIGDHVLDLSVLGGAGHFRGAEFGNKPVFSEPALNSFLALGRPAWRKAREIVQRLLSADQPTLREDAALRVRALIPQERVEMLLPARIGDYTDF